MSTTDLAATGLIVHSRQPLNAEPPLPRLAASFMTRRQDFYVRSHGSMPALDAASHRVRVEGRVDRKLALSLTALQTGFAQRTVAAVMQCAGNRRLDLARVRAVSGDLWQGGAIGQAEWTGVSLAEVLREAGASGTHVAFHGADDCEEGDLRFRYGVSIPMGKALDPDVLLAWAMNGAALAPEHGYPLRVVVPGFAGVRSAKWLERIEVRDAPWDGYYQAHEYKLFPPDATAETADYRADVAGGGAPGGGVVIEAMPLNAAICEPAADAVLRAGAVVVRGWAVASGRAVVRVDVSADGGRHWVQAALQQSEVPWGWTLWQATVALAAGQHELAARAWDDAGQTMPADAADTWNFKGYLSAAWHRVRVRAD